jgi:hypothetical protein
MPSKSGALCAVDLSGMLPTPRGNMKYIFVCYDVFSKHVKICALKSPTRTCLNKLLIRYFDQVIKPKVFLSENDMQFQSPFWK